MAQSKEKKAAAVNHLRELNRMQHEDLMDALRAVATDSLMPDELDGETSSCAMELITAFGIDDARTLAHVAAIGALDLKDSWE